MSEHSKIEWTDSTWNPVTGCTKVSAGCKNCYAERLAPRLGQDFSEIILHPDRLDAPLHWKQPRRIFVNSLSDLFHEDVPQGFVNDVLDRTLATPRHTYQILTKRPKRMDNLIREWMQDRKIIHPPKNVWLGVSCEDQKTADARIPLLLKTPAAVRFISLEPLLGPINLDRIPISHGIVECSGGRLPALDWVIVGGESRPHARPMHPDWARSIRDQCQAAGVPFFFKQWGEWLLDPVARSVEGCHGRH